MIASLHAQLDQDDVIIAKLHAERDIDCEEWANEVIALCNQVRELSNKGLVVSDAIKYASYRIRALS